MKKIIIIIALFVLSIGVHSCSLDKTPKTSIRAVKTPSDIQGVRNGMYSISRGLYMGSFIMSYDYMSDLLNETRSSGNRGHNFYNWQIYSNDRDVLDVWYNAYSLIARANLLLHHVDRIMDENPSDVAKLNLYKGEALLWRAIMHRYIALRFCVDYEPGTAASMMGIPYMTEYGRDVLADRGTLQNTYDKMLLDVNAAEALITTAGSPNAIFLTKDCVTAFKVQLYVDTHKYADAITEADKLIGKYTLGSTLKELSDMWLNDESNETIFHIALITDERSQGLQYSDYYGGEYNKVLDKDVINAGYVPSQTAVALYQAGDFRTEVNIKKGLLGKFDALLFHKYRGNQKLQNQGAGEDAPNYNCYNSFKLFRIADIVLLKAEAEYVGGAGNPLATLNTMRISRGLPASALTGDALFTEIQEERTRELFGEGNRLPDIKRWKITAKRAPQLEIGANNLAAPANHRMQIKHDADGIIWPIPLREFSANTLLKGQQNPGYSE